MSKATKLEYDKEILSLINDLSTINPSIILEKNGDQILINRTNPATTIAYRLTTDASGLNFEGDEIAFHTYQEFYQLLTCFEDPSIKQNDNKVIISEKNSKINYLLSDADTIKRGPKEFLFTDADIELELSSVDIKELVKMIGLLNSNKVILSCKSNKIDVCLSNSDHDNSFNKVYDATSEEIEDFELVISTDIFTLSPKGDYKISVKKEGIAKFELMHEKVKLDLYTAEIED